ncbi:predicted protein [Coccidioides posadasii str. Silveira]|uniref:Predicted protein n=1 Tax=Coccidioides posadasii (strain RMSCC 757 / Silveira) TaxID=443226 RepID=E9CYJ6_COCPS|nr:predicted protein [Coccidioides posadasii str. Silveira]
MVRALIDSFRDWPALEAPENPDLISSLETKKIYNGRVIAVRFLMLFSRTYVVVRAVDPRRRGLPG